MFEFDKMMSDFCSNNNLSYTRYADDITISSGDWIKTEEILAYVISLVKSSRINNLEINQKKTYLASKARSRRVTGLVISNEGMISLGRDRKRLISSMLHRAVLGQLAAEDLAKLRGLLSFSQDAEPAFLSRLEEKYGREIVHGFRRGAEPR
jgi:hypothetical protein